MLSRRRRRGDRSLGGIRSLGQGGQPRGGCGAGVVDIVQPAVNMAVAHARAAQRVSRSRVCDSHILGISGNIVLYLGPSRY
jgi:hypothetical protein